MCCWGGGGHLNLPHPTVLPSLKQRRLRIGLLAPSMIEDLSYTNEKEEVGRIPRKQNS
jgi:hypothetical protein